MRPVIVSFCLVTFSSIIHCLNSDCFSVLPAKYCLIVFYCYRQRIKTSHVKHGYLSVQWRNNGRDGVSNHQPHDYWLNRLFRRSSKSTSKLRVYGLCQINSPGAVESPTQRASNAEMFPFDDVFMTYVCYVFSMMVVYIYHKRLISKIQKIAWTPINESTYFMVFYFDNQFRNWRNNRL